VFFWIFTGAASPREAVRMNAVKLFCKEVFKGEKILIYFEIFVDKNRFLYYINIVTNTCQK
jgi:hypothetical protein